VRGVPVVLDINVLLDAVVSEDESAAFESFPSPPPLRGDPNATVLGILNDAYEVALWLSPHILDGVRRVLADEEGFGWDRANADRYCRILERIAERSGGGVVTPRIRVSDCEDWEDNRILELAAATGALLIISNDDDLQRMSPWRGTPVMSAEAFVARIDVIRRTQIRRSGG
jgi:predicted nucleic acid-binding protein